MFKSTKSKIILCIILIALVIGIFIIYENTWVKRSSMEENIGYFDFSEIKAYNAQFENFEGKRRGSEVSLLIDKLIEHINVYRDEIEKIPIIHYNNNTISYNKTDKEETQKYIEELEKIRENIENMNYYEISLSYGGIGIVNEITINDMNN